MFKYRLNGKSAETVSDELPEIIAGAPVALRSGSLVSSTEPCVTFGPSQQLL